MLTGVNKQFNEEKFEEYFKSLDRDSTGKITQETLMNGMIDNARRAGLLKDWTLWWKIQIKWNIRKTIKAISEAKSCQNSVYWQFT